MKEGFGGVPEEYAEWRPPAEVKPAEVKKETAGFMTWFGGKFKALLPVTIGLTLLSMSREAEAAQSKAIEAMKREEGIRMFATAGVIEQFMPESVTIEKGCKRIEAKIGPRDRLSDLYLASPKNRQELNKWDHWEKKSELYSNFKKDMEQRYSKHQGAVKKILNIVAKRFFKWGGGSMPGEESAGPAINGVPISEATVNDLVKDITGDLKQVDEVAKSFEKKTALGMLNETKEIEAKVAKEFVANSLQELEVSSQDR